MKFIVYQKNNKYPQWEFTEARVKRLARRTSNSNIMCEAWENGVMLDCCELQDMFNPLPIEVRPRSSRKTKANRSI